MNNSIRRININKLKSNRQSLNTKPYRSTTINSYKKGKSFYSKLLKQLGFCIIIVLLVIAIKSINTPLTNKTEEIIRNSMEQKVDIKKSFEKVLYYAKGFPSFPDKVVSVFRGEESPNTSIEMISPINGKIVSYFGENTDPILNQKTFQRGIDIIVEHQSVIKSVANGEVVEIGQSNTLGKYIRIKHEEDNYAIYGNCTSIDVVEGQKVLRGEPIAEIYPKSNENSNLFHFELWIDGDVVDPMQYISFEKRTI